MGLVRYALRRRSIRIPHTLVLLFSMIVLAQVATWLLPPGSFDRQETADGHEEVIAGSYRPVEDAPRLRPWHLFLAIPRGFAAAQGIIFFVFFVGGAFALLRATGAVDALLGLMLRRLGGRPGLLVAGGVLLFGVGSSNIGMAEEYLPFVPVLLVLTHGLGLDRLSAVGILCVGYGIGYGCAAINPFTVLIAQDIAQIPPTSGVSYRIVLFCLFAGIGIHHVRGYALRVRNDPTRSLVADVEPDHEIQPLRPIGLDARRAAVLGVLTASLVLIVWGINRYGWYLVELGAIFLGLSILLALLAGLGPDRAARTFCEGAGELTVTALLIGFARTIEVVLDDGLVIDTIVHAISVPLAQLGAGGASVGMLVFQSLCNFFIPSGSGQAFVTMPLMAPLADLLEINRQIAVLAYQFGDGLTNIVVPTNAVLVGILSMASVPFDRWLRFVLPFMVKAGAMAAVALIVGVWIGYA
jgi:uncharacterized ion transporter superfamily protein YfcC